MNMPLSAGLFLVDSFVQMSDSADKNMGLFVGMDTIPGFVAVLGKDMADSQKSSSDWFDNQLVSRKPFALSNHN